MKKFVLILFLFGLAVATPSLADCCTDQNQTCCVQQQACCSSENAEKAKPECCDQEQTCCEEQQACCSED